MKDPITLKPHQLAALGRLAVDPSAHVEPATLSFLRKRGLVGKVVAKKDGHQQTTSPTTEAGRRIVLLDIMGKPCPNHTGPSCSNCEGEG